MAFPRFLLVDELPRTGAFRISMPGGLLGIDAPGDVNGDGIDDFAVSATRTGADMVYFVFGRGEGYFPSQFDISNLNGSNGFAVRVRGQAHTFEHPLAFATPGDFNGDGLADFLFGEGELDSTNDGSGEVNMLYGSVGTYPALTDLVSDADATFNGTGPFTAFGSAVDSIGDFNGDGIDDFVVGAREADSNGLTDSGRAFIVFGQENFAAITNVSQLDGVAGFAIEGAPSFAALGWSVAGIGDFNGDGFDDVMIGAPRARVDGFAYAGFASIIFGSSANFAAQFDIDDLDGSNGFNIFGWGQDAFVGAQFAALGDVNGDGLADIALNAHLPGTDTRVTYVVFGRQSEQGATFDLRSVDGTNGFQITHRNNNYGSVNAAGDINGDGFDDLIISATSAYRVGGGYGEAYVIFGSGTGFPSSIHLANIAPSVGFTIQVSDENLRITENVAGIGDVNDDGYDDLMVSAHDSQDLYLEGFVMYGRTSNQTEGTAGADVLIGAGGEDELNGYGGLDHLEGRGDDDLLHGGTGIDILDGGLGNDFVYGDHGDDTVGGGAGNDTLFGNDGVDVLLGGDGGDILDGGRARDNLTGGMGADRFVFVTGQTGGISGTSADRIFDFARADGDQIDLSAFDAIAGNAGSAFTFIGAGAFSGTAGELRYLQRAGGGFTMIQGDTNGDGLADFAIRLDGLVDLASADFML